MMKFTVCLLVLFCSAVLVTGQIVTVTVTETTTVTETVTSTPTATTPTTTATDTMVTITPTAATATTTTPTTTAPTTTTTMTTTPTLSTSPTTIPTTTPTPTTTTLTTTPTATTTPTTTTPPPTTAPTTTTAVLPTQENPNVLLQCTSLNSCPALNISLGWSIFTGNSELPGDAAADETAGENKRASSSCFDEHQHCSYWKEYCCTNEYVIRFCNFTCGRCDKDPNCHYWSSYCNSTLYVYVKQNCGVTCDICAVTTTTTTTTPPPPTPPITTTTIETTPTTIETTPTTPEVEGFIRLALETFGTLSFPLVSRDLVTSEGDCTCTGAYPLSAWQTNCQQQKFCLKALVRRFSTSDETISAITLKLKQYDGVETSKSFNSNDLVKNQWVAIQMEHSGFCDQIQASLTVFRFASDVIDVGRFELANQECGATVFSDAMDSNDMLERFAGRGRFLFINDELNKIDGEMDEIKNKLGNL